MLSNIPFELQQLDQWVCAGPDKVPLNPRTGRKADPTDRRTWGSFQEALQCGYPHIGFVLSEEDPYTIIDLDDPTLNSDGQPETDEELVEERRARHLRIIEAFPSYSEVSQSGRGIHIICKGSVPKGVRRDRVEVYSTERYMICTGVIYRPLPIIDCQEFLDALYAQISVNQHQSVELKQIDGHLSDDEILTMAVKAANSDKFARLWEGVFDDYPSQSEADFALLSMLAFYTKDNEQVRRLFRQSALGQREKAVRNDSYINIALGKIRALQPPEIDFTESLKAGAKLTAEITTSGGSEEPAEETPEEGPDASEEKPVHKEQPVDFPPGLIGDLAEYFYSSSIRPVRQISLVGAIGLLAGIVGRTYNINSTGLNQYLILIAKTGSGKESIATNIDSMVTAVRSSVPSVDQFIGPGTFASGQGLVRVLDKQNCFVSVLGEFGFTLKSICSQKASASQEMLKKVLLDIYAKSGFSKTLRPSVYSDSDRNTKVVQAPNVTIVGESTPETFYEGLDSSLIAEGLIPRFHIFEYNGPRPPRNKNAFHPPDRELVNRFGEVLAIALTAEQNRVCCPVQVDQSAQSILDDFDAHADRKINSASHDVVLQLWNRAHLKALKLAALVAVGSNPHQPIVDSNSASWAIRLIEQDIDRLLAHFATGDIGSGDTKMEADIRRAVTDYLGMSKTRRAEYGVSEKLRAAPVVPLSFLRRRLRPLASFRTHRLGANAALSTALKAMTEARELELVPAGQALLKFGVHSPIYCVGPEW